MTTYTNEEKLKLFKNELEDIQDNDLREFAEEMIKMAPDYFFTCPASSTGKYHPTLSLGEGGLVRHTRLVVWFARNIATAMMLEERSKDLLTVAALAHDMKKHGNGVSKYTVNEHPKLAADFLEDVWNSIAWPETMKYDDIVELQHLVHAHMGQWGEKDGMPKPTTKMELILHTADYLASRKEINDFAFRPVEEVEIKVEPVSDYRLIFGKHKGKTLEQLYEENKDEAIDYYEWVINNKNFKFTEAKEKIKLFLEEKKKDLEK